MNITQDSILETISDKWVYANTKDYIDLWSDIMDQLSMLKSLAIRNRWSETFTNDLRLLWDLSLQRMVKSKARPEK